MKKEFPLFPELQEQAADEAVQLIEKFKAKLKDAADETISTLYCDILSYIESDSWNNFRKEIMDGMLNYKNKKITHAYEFDKIRRQIFKEYKDEIIKDLNNDLINENEALKAEVEELRKRNNELIMRGY